MVKRSMDPAVKPQGDEAGVRHKKDLSACMPKPSILPLLLAKGRRCRRRPIRWSGAGYLAGAHNAAL